MIGVLGNIGAPKGAAVLAALSRHLADSQAAGLVLIGNLDPAFTLAPGARIHGSYRREDIPVLAEYFVRKHQQRTGKRIDRIEDGVHEKLAAYEWPGNVRELENTIERAVVLSTTGAISIDAISVLGVAAAQSNALPSLKLRTNIEWIEQETIRRALDSAGGVKKEAADLMGISQRALSYYLSKYKFQ